MGVWGPGNGFVCSSRWGQRKAFQEVKAEGAGAERELGGGRARMAVQVGRGPERGQGQGSGVGVKSSGCSAREAGRGWVGAQAAGWDGGGVGPAGGAGWLWAPR